MHLAKILTTIATLISIGPISTCARATNHGFPFDWDRSHAGETLDLKGYRAVFDDEFDSLRLSGDGEGGPWFAPIHTPMGMGDLAVPPDPAYAVTDGVLTLSTRIEDGRWREANIQTEDSSGRGFSLQNGYFEARIELPKQSGAHAGFWLLSRQDHEKGHVEFDVVESYGAHGSTGHHATSHLWPGHKGDHPIFTSNITPTPSLLSSFHTFGTLATDDRFIVYYDRREVARIPRLPMQRAPMYPLLSLFENAADPPQEPAMMKVDWVRIYAPPTSP
jgi:hypothetical protein